MDAFPNKLREYLFDAFGPLDFVAVDRNPPIAVVRFMCQNPDADGKHMLGKLTF